ncbi:MAG TPA: hypothetical protein VGN82_14385 [Bosea sp. (in: a-proteobacteria)]|jgi:uncharacterized protein (UPF0335 family)|uniref:hypothetical protein n=1 Tax=Bosea sp. (in: a-proteobacteria) TaxID=1871050 RepID=UPI002E137C2F|nr:hypothetical protein [Bosea sp. (in: a-proteobacteria)]
MSNGFDSAVLKRFVTDIERHHETIASYKGEHAQRVKSVQELITEVFDRAKDAGIPRKELKTVIKERRLLVQIENLREELEEDQQETLDQIKHALGMISDLPLGEAALKRSDAIDSLTDDDDEDGAAGKANAAALRGGIAPLN